MAKKEKNKEEKKPTHQEVTVKCHNAAGKYGLPYNYGQKAKLEIKQAEEMISAGDAE